MTPTVTLEVPAQYEALIRCVLLLAEELDQLALAAPHGTVFDACESAVVGGGRKVQTQMLQDAVARRIETAQKRVMICVCSCGKWKENHGPKTHQMVSLVGVISVTRRYWQCRCGEPGAYAADELIGLESRFSRRVQKHACRLAADTSFAKTSEHLDAMLGVAICPETVRTLMESHGKATAVFQLNDPTTDAAFAKAKGEIEFAVDAGKVNTREEGWKDLKIGVISKRERCAGVSCAGWESQR